MLKLAVRWNTVRCAASLATTGMTWMPVDPVPMMPTRWPAKSTPSLGHFEVWYHCPPNDSAPLKSGMFVAFRLPVAAMTKRAVTSSPRSVPTCHRDVASSKRSRLTRVPNWIWSRMPNWSATWLA